MKPNDVRLLRQMFSRQNSYGHLVGVLNCGILCGLVHLPSHEGESVVVEALNEIWRDPATRPDIIFYDK